jgi:hypothetical protein
MGLLAHLLECSIIESKARKIFTLKTKQTK